MTVNRGDGGGAARELAAGLRALRERAGLSTRALGEAANTSAAAISNWERDRLPSEQRLTQLLDALGASDDERERLQGLRRQAEGPGQLVSGAPSIGEQLARLIEHEQVARRITTVAPLLIPGLLQTSDYARATLGAHRDIDTRIALRVGRRDVLTRTRQPAELVAFIDSEVLVRPVAPPQVMADQLRHLLKMAELPNVTIQLVSSASPGYNPMLAGPFIMIEFPTASPIVHVEHYQASAFIWEATDVHGFQAAVEKIHNVAMTPAETARVIAKIVHGMETT
jgi:transcriptional regulator with XRE-family HTH domain